MKLSRQGVSGLAYARRGAGPPPVLLHGLCGSAARLGALGLQLVVIPGAGHSLLCGWAAAFSATVLPFLPKPTEVLKTG